MANVAALDMEGVPRVLRDLAAALAVTFLHLAPAKQAKSSDTTKLIAQEKKATAALQQQAALLESQLKQAKMELELDRSRLKGLEQVIERTSRGEGALAPPSLKPAQSQPELNSEGRDSCIASPPLQTATSSGAIVQTLSPRGLLSFCEVPSDLVTPEESSSLQQRPSDMLAQVASTHAPAKPSPLRKMSSFEMLKNFGKTIGGRFPTSPGARGSQSEASPGRDKRGGFWGKGRSSDVAVEPRSPALHPFAEAHTEDSFNVTATCANPLPSARFDEPKQPSRVDGPHSLRQVIGLGQK